MAAKCTLVRDDGTRCGAYLYRGYDEEDPKYCYFHHPQTDMHEVRRRGGNKTGSSRRKLLPPGEYIKIDVQEEIDAVIPVFQRALDQLEVLHPSAQVLATIGNVASGLDRAMARREARGADVTRIEVVYVNDWRA